MKIFQVLLLVLVGIGAQSQDQKLSTQLESFTKTTKRLEFLQALKQHHQNLHRGSFGWIYLPVNFELKSRLRKEIDFAHAELKYRASKFEWDAAVKSTLDSSIRALDTLISRTTINMMNLQTFEDYEDSLNLGERKESFQEIAGISKGIDLQLGRIIAHEDQNLARILKEIGSQAKNQRIKVGKESFVDIQKITNDSDALNAIRQALEISWQVYDGTLKLVYTPENSESEKQLLQNTTITLPAIIDRLKYAAEQGAEPIDKLRYDSTIVHLESLQTISGEIRESFNFESAHDDPITVLMAEDRIETGLNQNFDYAQSNLRHLKWSYEEKLETLISTTSDKKIRDIKTMLRQNYSNLNPLIAQSLKNLNGDAAEKFNIEELINALVPIYDKRFSHDEILEILKFQNSKVGKKLNENSKEIFLEAVLIANTYFKKLSSEKD